MINIKNTKNLLKSELCRAIESKRILISVIMVIMILFAASFEGISFNEDILYLFSIVMYGMPAMIILIPGTFAHGDSICNDIEHKYISDMILKGGLNEYVVTKILSIFITAMISIVFGILCYVGILHFFIPWTQKGGNQYEFLMQSGSFRYFLGKNMFLSYFLLYGIQYGFLAGSLAVFSAYLSLYITNKMLVLATPFLVYYFMDFILADLFQEKITLATVFSASNNLLKNDLKSFLLALVVSTVFLVTVGMLTRRKIKKEYLS